MRPLRALGEHGVIGQTQDVTNFGGASGTDQCPVFLGQIDAARDVDFGLEAENLAQVTRPRFGQKNTLFVGEIAATRQLVPLRNSQCRANLVLSGVVEGHPLRLGELDAGHFVGLRTGGKRPQERHRRSRHAAPADEGCSDSSYHWVFLAIGSRPLATPRPAGGMISHFEPL